MSILKKVCGAIDASRNANLSISEDPGRLSVSGQMPSVVLSVWQEVRNLNCSWFQFNFIDDSDDPIEPQEGIGGERFRLSLIFESPKTTPHIFTSEGWRSLLHNQEALLAVKTVRLAFILEGFKTRAFNVEPWLNDEITLDEQEPQIASNVSPRKMVRCQSPALLAPLQIEPWLLVGSPLEHCPAISIWRDISAQMIVKSLINELYKDSENAKVVLSGQPPKKLELGSFREDIIPFSVLQNAANWVYLEGEDIEVRHTFLSSELARAWTTNIPFCEGLPEKLANSLDSARLLYKAHLRSGSKDIIKALADLRKTLADEVQKLMQQAKDLSNAVWRDVAIAIGVIGVRFAMESAKVDHFTLGFAVIYFSVALYIAVSYAITVTTNTRFLNIVEKSRQSWRTKLYAFLDDTDYKTLAEEPLKDAVLAYQNTQKHTTYVVCSVVVVLLVISVLELRWLELNDLFESFQTFWHQLREIFAAKIT